MKLPKIANENKKIRIGVVGLGRIGWQHCIRLHKHPDFLLAAVADREESRCLEAERDFGCAPFSSFKAMLDGAYLDAVVIASPTHLHREMALLAFSKGLHVFLEKPMASSLKEAEAIYKASKKSGCVLTVYQPHRAAAYFIQLKKIIASGKLGDVYHYRRGNFKFVRRDDWQTLLKFGGGMLFNFGAHAVDQLLNLTGSNIKRYFCDLRLVAALGDAEDVIKLVYETKDGVIGELDVNQASVTNPYEFEVYGTHGTAFLKNGCWELRTFSPRAMKKKKLNTSLAVTGRKYPSETVKVKEEFIKIDRKNDVDVYADFAGAVRGKHPPFVKPEETLTVMRFLDNCRSTGGLQKTHI
ncbi:MAG: Gfo/Idh/MocA family oxidoreductase [Candidatus Firestonebacteria bacterium]|nr:Gfo/Idh/MocA family oxidoreductase [Candidatus Firestonebacteria bacterium]